jgi:hypothetical protein
VQVAVGGLYDRNAQKCGADCETKREVSVTEGSTRCSYFHVEHYGARIDLIAPRFGSSTLKRVGMNSDGQFRHFGVRKAVAVLFKVRKVSNGVIPGLWPSALAGLCPRVRCVFSSAFTEVLLIFFGFPAFNFPYNYPKSVKVFL